MNYKRMLRIGMITLISAVALMSAQKWVANQASRQGTQASIYYCPMHPSYTSPKPGTCPICNMNLVKKEEEQKLEADHSSHHHDASETPDPGKVKPREVTVDELMKMKPGEICLLHKCKMGHCMMAMSEEFARLGKCPHCGEDLGVTIKNAPPQGYSELHLGAEKQEILGIKTDAVQNIQLSKEIRTVGRIAYDPELYQAQEEYLQALSAVKKSQNSDVPEIQEQAVKLLDSAKIKLRLLGLNEELIKTIETSGKADKSLLYSDQGGSVWLYAQVYEYELPYVKVGDKIEASVPGVSGKKFSGVIRSIDSVLDPMTRSARVRAVLENPDGLFKPEMYADASLKVDAGLKLAVREEAVFKTGEKNIVFVVNEKGVIEPREVVLGISTDEYAEIRSGVGEGEKVVTNGNFLIDSESRLKAALDGAGKSAGGHQHGA